MSRAIDVKVSEPGVISRFAKHGASASAVETLASGGACVVLYSGEAAATMRHVLRKELLPGEIRRTAFRFWAR